MKRVISSIFAGAVFFSLAGCLNPIHIDTGIPVDGSSKNKQPANSILVLLSSDTDAALSITALQLLKAGVPVANIFPRAEQAGKSYVFEGVSADTGYEVRVAAAKHEDITISGIDIAQGEAVSRVIRLTKQWKVSSFAGASAGYMDNLVGAGAQFNTPFGLAFDKRGDLYASDSRNYRIRKLEPSAHVICVAGDGNSGTFDVSPPTCSGLEARFQTPSGLAYDSKGNVLYVTDSGSNRIRKIYNLVAGGYNVLTIAGSGSAGNTNNAGDATAAEFSVPLGLAYDSARSVLYVADSGNHSIREIIGLNKTPGAQLFAGGSVGTADGNGLSANFNTPTGLAYDSAREALYVADSQNHAIRKITDLDGVKKVETIAGDRSNAGSDDGLGTAAKFDTPASIALDGSNNILYVADSGNHSIRKIDLTTSPVTVSTIAGGAAGHGDGAGTAALFGGINGIAVSGAGDVYVTESGTPFHGVRKLSLNW